MRTTVTLDDRLLDAAQKFSGVKEKSALLNLALKKYVEREAARRLAQMGGSDANATAGARRKSEEE